MTWRTPRSTILQNFIALCQPTPEISVTKILRTNKKQTVTDISTTCLSACVDNNTLHKWTMDISTVDVATVPWCNGHAYLWCSCWDDKLFSFKSKSYNIWPEIMHTINFEQTSQLNRQTKMKSFIACSHRRHGQDKTRQSSRQSVSHRKMRRKLTPLRLKMPHASHPCAIQKKA